MNWTPTSFSVALTLATGTALQNDWMFNSQGIKLLAQNKMTETPEDYLPKKKSFFWCILLCFSSGHQRWHLSKAQAFAVSLIPASLGKKAAGCPHIPSGSTVAVSLSTKPQLRVINRTGTWTPPFSTSCPVLFLFQRQLQAEEHPASASMWVTFCKAVHLCERPTQLKWQWAETSHAELSEQRVFIYLFSFG